MTEISKKNEEKKVFFVKIRTFFWKFNPYRKLNIIEEDGTILEPKWFLYYASFMQWFVDIFINGLVSNFILSVLGRQNFSVIYWIANGMAIWLGWKLLTKIYDYYVNGQISIARNKG